jgi:hypothetical protein
LISICPSFFFSDCGSAIAYFQDGLQAAPKYVFLDLNLHQINSDQDLLQLLSLNEFNPVSIIIYSASIPGHRHSRLQSLGISTFIEKTGAIPVLTGQLRNLISRDHPLVIFN